MKRLKRLWAHDIGIDLGTANTLVYVRDKGVVVNEPSVVAINKKTKDVIAVGSEAKDMIGKTPEQILAARPLVDGVVSDFEVTEQMLQYFIGKIHKEHPVIWQRPRVVVGVPSGVTEVEKRAVESASASAGARTTYLVEEPMAAAVGCRLPVTTSTGSMIVDIGGGTTEVAVISLGGIVVSRSLRTAGDELTEGVMQYLRDEFNVSIGERTAENIKLTIGSAHPLKQVATMPVRGRDMISGMPKEVSVSSDQLRLAMVKTVRAIVEAVKVTLEETPPELVSDIMEQGIVLTGGGALLQNLDVLIAQETKMKVVVAEDPLRSVVKGTGLIIEDLAKYTPVLISSQES
ncbi:MAG: rod shape-determining protein [Candidatus Saccharimonadales bacterium]